MDILNVCSATKHIIESFKQAVNSCTTYIRYKQSVKSHSTPTISFYNNQEVNAIENYQLEPNTYTDVATQTPDTPKADTLTTNQFSHTCLTIELEEKQINQCFNITQDQDITIEEAQTQIKDLLKLVSVENIGTLTTVTNATEHKIELLPNTTPIKQKMRRVMYHFQEKFNKLIDDMVQSGKIIPSNSSWASPVRLVAKPDGGVRFTVDYKQLNIYTKKVAYSLPLIDEIFQRLSKAVYFTVLDLTSAYNQVSIHPDSRECTAFFAIKVYMNIQYYHKV
jgi:hypothetical protein